MRLWGGPGRCPPEVDAWAQVKPCAVGFDDRGRLVTLEPPSAGQFDAGGLRWFDPPSPVAVAESPLPREGRPPSADGDGPDRRRGRGPMSKGEGGLASQAPVRIDRRSFARSQDGRTFAFFRSNGDLLIGKAEATGLLAKLNLPRIEAGPGGRGMGGNLLALAPDGSRLYHCAYNRLFVYSLRNPGPEAGRALWSAEVREAYSLAISPDGRTLAVGERSGELALIDAAAGTIRRPPAPLDDAGAVTSLAFAPDGRTLAVGARDVIRLWDVTAQPHPLVRLPGHRGSLSALAFDARGLRLAGADEKVTRVWDLAGLHDELARLGLGW